MELKHARLATALVTALALVLAGAGAAAAQVNPVRPPGPIQPPGPVRPLLPVGPPAPAGPTYGAAEVQFVNALLEDDALAAALQQSKGALALADGLGAGKAGDMFAVEAGQHALKIDGRYVDLAKQVRLTKGHEYCIAVVTLKRGPAVLVEDATHGASGDLAQECKALMARWMR